MDTFLNIVYALAIICAIAIAIWSNLRSGGSGKSFLLRQDGINTPDSPTRFAIEQSLSQVFRATLRQLDTVVVAPNKQWFYAELVVDFIESPHRDPSYWKVETSYRVFARRLAKPAPEIALDNRRHGSVNPLYAYGWKIKNGELVYCEAAFMDRFKLYCHPGSEAEVLSLLAPDALVTILDNMTGTDMYIVGDHLYCIMPNRYVSNKRIEQVFSQTEAIVRELDTNLPRAAARH
ncbi:MAG TPA: hypothetical protein VF597_03135 [Candidatus Saccharimonadales bacterium]|jgi:hypothetical protein